MPIIQMTIAEGRTVEQKAEAMAAVTEAVVRTLDARPEQVRIIINEVSSVHYAVAGETLAMRTARDTASSRAALPEEGS